MSSHVSRELRRLVVVRAEGLCEYCLIHEEDTFFGGEVEHVVAIQHGGPTEADNLAFACLFCNRHKGTNLVSLLPSTGELVRLYHPRRDRWAEHFRLDGATIRPLTAVGDVTARLLEFNVGDRLLERRVLMAAGRYPSAAALRRMQVS